ncbi:MAG: DUF4349 domain-containing protein [Micromonosporaceae bacterium]
MRRRTGMTMQDPRRIRVGVGAAAACIVSGLLLSGCGAGASSSSAIAGKPAAKPAAGFAAGSGNHRVPLAAAPQADSASRSNSSGQAEKRAAIPLGSDIVFTASLTVRTRDVSQEQTHAQQIVSGAGGYVSNESSSIDPRHPARSTASLELKIPVGAYPATLDKLATGLGTQVSLRQQAQDMTETVADVNSRVNSAQAAIAQLRTLLSRASSIGDLLNIQGQISQQEAALESLQAQQRALNHETAFATVSLQLIGTLPPPVKQKPRRHLAGFVRGLSAGWRALRVFGSGLLAVVGALIPFAVFIAAGAYLAYRGRRWLARRRMPPTPAKSATAE